MNLGLNYVAHLGLLLTSRAALCHNPQGPLETDEL